MNTLRWFRIPGDSLFAVGALVLAWFVLGLVTGHSFDKSAKVLEGESFQRPRVQFEEEKELVHGD